VRTWSAFACLSLLAGLGGCVTPPPPYDFTDFNRAPPRSILIIPVANRSLDVDASNYVLSTLTVPLAELGYYVFPVNTVKIVLEQEGLYEPEQVRKLEPARLASMFGADAVLFITINRWDAQYVVISTTVTVEMDYLMTGRDGGVIWKTTKRMQYSPQQQQNQGQQQGGEKKLTQEDVLATIEKLAKLKEAGLRVHLDDRNEKLQAKIRDAQLEKIPYMLVCGQKEREAGTVSVRSRAEGDLGAESLDAFVARCQELLRTRAPKP